MIMILTVIFEDIFDVITKDHYDAYQTNVISLELSE